MSMIPTPHINAKKSHIAKTVIMPGDPLRAKFIAKTYLEKYFIVNSIRNMLAYTGYYKGKKVTVMGSGMGMASIAIYSFELFSFYDVDNIIRVGTAGAFVESLNIGDVLLSTSAHTLSNFSKNAFGVDENTLFSSEKLNFKIRKSASDLNIKLHSGKIETSDVFYKTTLKEFRKNLEKEGCLACDMETYALLANANACQKQATSVVTIANNMKNRIHTPAKIREQGFVDMIEIVLESII